MFLNDIDDGTYSPSNVPEVRTFEIYPGKSKILSVFDKMAYTGCPDQGLAWNASIVEAVTTKFALFFNNESLCPCLGCPGCDGKTCRTPSQNGYVIIVLCHGFLLLFENY
jgi:hypothetical protein